MRTKRHVQPEATHRTASVAAMEGSTAGDLRADINGHRLEEIISRITDGHHTPGLIRTEDGHTLVEITLRADRRRRNRRGHHARRVQRITFTPNDQPREE